MLLSMTESNWTFGPSSGYTRCARTHCYPHGEYQQVEQVPVSWCRPTNRCCCCSSPDKNKKMCVAPLFLFRTRGFLCAACGAVCLSLSFFFCFRTKESRHPFRVRERRCVCGGGGWSNRQYPMYGEGRRYVDFIS